MRLADALPTKEVPRPVLVACERMVTDAIRDLQPLLAGDSVAREDIEAAFVNLIRVRRNLFSWSA